MLQKALTYRRVLKYGAWDGNELLGGWMSTYLQWNAEDSFLPLFPKCSLSGYDGADILISTWENGKQDGQDSHSNSAYVLVGKRQQQASSQINEQGYTFRG